MGNWRVWRLVPGGVQQGLAKPFKDHCGDQGGNQGNNYGEGGFRQGAGHYSVSGQEVLVHLFTTGPEPLLPEQAWVPWRGGQEGET